MQGIERTDTVPSRGSPSAASIVSQSDCACSPASADWSGQGGSSSSQSRTRPNLRIQVVRAVEFEPFPLEGVDLCASSGHAPVAVADDFLIGTATRALAELRAPTARPWAASHDNLLKSGPGWGVIAPPSGPGRLAGELQMALTKKEVSLCSFVSASEAAAVVSAAAASGPLVSALAPASTRAAAAAAPSPDA